MGEVGGIGEKLSALLVQLPPSLQFDRQIAKKFFALLHDKTDCRLVCEPRHASWFEPGADALLSRLRVGRVA
ncbi:DUF72 domain-containing protein, partial [Mesorhizobium sp.]